MGDVTSAPSALVLGSGLTALGAIRSLGRAGIPVLVPPAVPASLSRYSRWYRPAPGQGSAVADGLAEYLDALPIERAVLIPCSDEFVRAVGRVTTDPALGPRFPASVAHPDRLRVLLDKGEFAELAARLAIPHPRTIPLESADDLGRLADHEIATAFVKPRDSQSFFARHGVKAFRGGTRDRLLELLHELSGSDSRVLLQEYIPGPASSHYFVDGFADRTGTIRALFARRRLRMYPPDFGNSTLMHAIPLEDVSGAVSSIRRIVEELRYRGVFSAEFKRDPRDDRFKILEVNVRPWWYVEFAARCGVNVCSMAYQDALGRPVTDCPAYRSGRHLIHAYYDFFACRAGQGGRAAGIMDWLMSCATADGAVHAWDDPVPGVMEAADRIRSWVRRG